jgi:hypothetical protein
MWEFFFFVMPNRYVRASAIESESINALSWRAEVFYRRLLNRADDFGRYTASPQLLRASLFPLQLDRISDADIADLLAECESVGLIFRYDAKGKPLLVINKWEQGRAKTSEYSPPPESINKRMQTYVYICKRMHPTPTPTPTPPPTERARSGLPESLDTVGMREAWGNWLQHWSEHFASGKPMPEQTAHSQLRKLAEMGPIKAHQAIENSIARGLREPALPLNGSTTARPGAPEKGLTLV